MCRGNQKLLLKIIQNGFFAHIAKMKIQLASKTIFFFLLACVLITILNFWDVVKLMSRWHHPIHCRDTIFKFFLWLTRKKGPLPRNSDELFTLKAQKNGFKRHLNQFISMFFVKFLMIFFKWRIPKDLLKLWSNITNVKTNYLLQGMPNKLANTNFCKSRHSLNM